MSEDDIKKYYGTLDMQQLKMVALSRKIYPWRKVPIIRGEDAAYAAQNINARRAIVWNDKPIYGFSALNSNYNLPIPGSPTFIQLASGVESIFSRNNRKWIDPEADLPVAGFHEIYVEDNSIYKYLNNNGYFLTELDERPSCFLQESNIPSKDLVAWTNKSFEKMTTCLINHKWKDGYSTAYIYVEVYDSETGHIIPDILREYHSSKPSFSGYTERHTFPYLDSIKIIVEEEKLDAAEVDFDYLDEYHGDWIDKVKILSIFDAQSLHRSYETDEYKYSRKSFLLVIDETYLTAQHIADAYVQAKRAMGFTEDVHGEWKEFSMKLVSTGVIVKINKNELMITGD